MSSVLDTSVISTAGRYVYKLMPIMLINLQNRQLGELVSVTLMQSLKLTRNLDNSCQ
jgi:hypothetical protein